MTILFSIVFAVLIISLIFVIIILVRQTKKEKIEKIKKIIENLLDKNDFIAKEIYNISDSFAIAINWKC